MGTPEELHKRMKWFADYTVTDSFKENLRLSTVFKKSSEYKCICDVISQHLTTQYTPNERAEMQTFMMLCFNEDRLVKYNGDPKLYWKGWYWRKRLNYLKEFKINFYNNRYNHLLTRV